MNKRADTENNSQHGQAMVEFALVAIVFLALAVGGIEGIRLIAERHSLASANVVITRQIAERGGVYGDIETDLIKELKDRNLDPDDVFLSITVRDPTAGEIISKMETGWGLKIAGRRQGDGKCEQYGQILEVGLVKRANTVKISGLFMDALGLDRYRVVQFDKCWRGGE